MAWILFLMFVGMPIAEIAVLIQAGDAIGLWPTIGLVILTAAAGAALARAEGRAAMRRLSEAMESGQAPAGPLLDAAGVFVGGILLLTPGFITDGIGLSLLFRPTRRLWGRLFAWLRRPSRGHRQSPGGGGPYGDPFGGQGASRSNPGDRGEGPVVIEGDYVETSPDDETPKEGPGGPTRP